MKILKLTTVFFLCVVMAACDGHKNQGHDESESLKSCDGFAVNSFSQQLYWQPKFPIKISIHKSIPVDFREEVLKALKNWNDATRFEIFVIDPAIDESVGPKEDGKNVIYWQTTWDEKKADLQASTNLYWSDHRIREADIILDAKYFKISLDPQSDEIDFQSLLVHELGHIFGLGHVDNSSSVMVSKLAYGEKRRQPSDDDLKNLSCRY